MGRREEIISELSFLDESSVVFDENPKEKGKNKLNKEVPDTPVNQSLLSMIDGLGDDAALAILEAYKKIPKKVKDAVNGFYDALQGLGGDTTMQDIKECLKGLKEACGDEYAGVYKSSVKDAKKLVPKIQTRLMMEGIDEDNHKQD